MFLMFSIFVNGQTSVYHPFPDSNAVWNFEIFLPFGCDFFGQSNVNYSIIITSDTIINSQSYHKLIIPLLSSSSYCVGSTGYQGAIRQDNLNKKVFYIPQSENQEQLLYDFNMQVGDTVKGLLEICNGSQKDIVQSIDSILIGNDYRKKWNFVCSNDYGYYIIEGLGSTYGLIKCLPGCLTDQNSISLTCFQQNGKSLYPDTTTNCQIITSINNTDKILNEITLYPNPATDKITITQNGNLAEESIISIFNMAGQQIISEHFNGQNLIQMDVSNLAKGIYFVKIQTNAGVESKKLVIQ